LGCCCQHSWHTAFGKRERSSRMTDETGWKLHITDHTVHKASAEDLIVSTLKPFSISVGLGDEDDLRIVEHEPAHLTCELLYENGQPVPTPLLPEQRTLIHGGTALLQGGRATFKLRLSVLSSQHGFRKFRLRLAVAREEGSSPLPHIASVITDPMRTITKLHRGPRQPADGVAAKRGIEEVEDDLEGDEEGPPPPKLSALRRVVEEQSASIRELQGQHAEMRALLKETFTQLELQRGRDSDMSVE